MSIKNKSTRTGEFILSEANGSRSREVVTVTGGPYQAGQVLEINDITKKYLKSNGGQNAIAILLSEKLSSADEELVIIARDAEVDDRSIEWGILTPAKKDIGTASLANKNIIVR